MISDWLESTGEVVIVIAFFLFIIELFALVSTCILCKAFRSENAYYYWERGIESNLMTWSFNSINGVAYLKRNRIRLNLTIESLNPSNRTATLFKEIFWKSSFSLLSFFVSLFLKHSIVCEVLMVFLHLFKCRLNSRPVQKLLFFPPITLFHFWIFTDS